MKKIFICSPLRASTSKGIKINQLKAQKYAKEVYSKGCLPIFTHIYLDLFAPELKDDNPVQRKKIINLGFELLKDCNEMWIFGNIISKGMKQEIEFCKKNNIKMKFVEFTKKNHEMCDTHKHPVFLRESKSLYLRRKENLKKKEKKEIK